MHTINVTLFFDDKSCKIPVFFHYLKGYDSHLIIQELNKFPDVKFSGIPQNTEKFISFSINNLVFKDSLAFLPSSLKKLVKSTKYTEFMKDKIKCKTLNENWEDNFKITKKNNDYIKSNNDLHLLTDKGIYPYGWVDDIEKFKIKQLPHRSMFY